MGHEFTILVDKHSKDFGESSGVRILKPESTIPFELRKSVDVIIHRDFAKNNNRVINLMRKNDALDLTYDQHRIGESLRCRFSQAMRRIIRVLQGRPQLRLSPALSKNGITEPKVSKWDYFFDHPGPEPQEEAELPTSNPNELGILLVGKKYNSRKKLDRALVALKRIDKNLSIHVVQSTPDFTSRKPPSHNGLRYQKRIVRLARESHHNVTLYEDLTMEQLDSLHLSSDILILPSSRETFSIVNFEAASKGVLSIIRKSNGSYFAMPKGTVSGLGSFFLERQITSMVINFAEDRLTNRTNRETILSNYRNWFEQRVTIPDAIDAVIYGAKKVKR